MQNLYQLIQNRGFRFLLPLIFSLCAVAGVVHADYATLDEAYAAAGFDPEASGVWVFAAVGDTHYLVGEHTHLPAIDEVNAMDPAPAFFMVAGDLICSASLDLGRIPSESDKQEALREFELCKSDLDTLNVPYKLVLGNHDTYVYEDPHGYLFHQVFTDEPLYTSFTTNNVCFILLNAHGSGYLKETDSTQWQWVQNLVATLPPTQSVICMQHYPRVGDNVEHGLSRTIPGLFDNHEGELWMLCGHDMSNRVRTYELPHTTLIEAELKDSFVKPGAGYGWWIYCMQNDHVFARIFRNYDAGYSVDPAPVLEGAVEIPAPFEGVAEADILWSVLPGVDDDNRTSAYVVSSVARDCVTHWFYVNDLIYQLPLSNHLAVADNFAILGRFSNDCTISASHDNVSWQTVPFPVPRNNLYLFPIPDICRTAGKLYVRIHTGYMSGTSVGGFALTRTPAPPLRAVDNPTPGAPANLTAVIDDGIQLQWSLSPDDGAGAADVSGYHIYRRTESSGFSFLSSVPAGSHSYVDRDTLINGELYIYMVCASDAVQQSRALDFDGINDCIALGSTLELGSGAFSLAGWVRLREGTPLASYLDNYGIFFKGAWGQPLLQLSMRGGLYNGIFCRTYDATLPAYRDLKPATDQSSVFLDGRWHHICAVRDAGSQGVLYIDGSPMGTMTGFAGSVSNDYNAVIGCCSPGNVRSCFFPGSIDEFKIYSRALTSVEVTDLYDSSLTPTNGLLSWWKLNSTNGVDAVDELIRDDGVLNNFNTDRCWTAGRTGSLVSVTNTLLQPGVLPVTEHLLFHFKVDEGLLDANGNPATDGVDVQTWQDHSGNGYHLSPSYMTRRPTYQYNITTNGMPGLYFDGTRDMLQRVPLDSGTVTINSLFMVFKPVAAITKSTSPQILLNQSGTETEQLALGSYTGNFIDEIIGTRSRDSSGSQQKMSAYKSATESIEALTILSVIYNSTASAFDLYLDGTSVRNGINGVDDNGFIFENAPLYLGSQGPGITPFGGHIFEVIAYSNVLSTVDRQSVEDYLEFKFTALPSNGILILVM